MKNAKKICKIKTFKYKKQSNLFVVLKSIDNCMFLL